MADIAFDQFSLAFRERLEALGYSQRVAEQKWPQTDRAMLSRAVNGKTLSAGNYLLLCRLAGFDPYTWFEEKPHRRVTMASIGNSVRAQMVTADVPRETQRETGAAR